MLPFVIFVLGFRLSESRLLVLDALVVSVIGSNNRKIKKEKKHARLQQDVSSICILQVWRDFSKISFSCQGFPFFSDRIHSR